MKSRQSPHRFLLAGAALFIGAIVLACGFSRYGSEEPRSGQLIGTSTYHTCFITESKGLKCWGYNTVGQLGYGNTTAVGHPASPSIAATGEVPVGGTVKSVCLNYENTCVLLHSGAVRCWGDNTFGELGHSNPSNIGDGVGLSIIAAGDVPIGGSVSKLSCGRYHVCVLLEAGTMRCWGTNGTGQLGYGNTNQIGGAAGTTILAAGYVAAGGRVIDISAGSSHTCALLESGNVRCWETDPMDSSGTGI